MKPRSLSQAVQTYLQERRQLGFALKEDGWMLHGLVDYAAQQGHRGPLTTKLAVAWAQAPAHAQPRWWARRLETVGRFAVYWKALDPRVERPPTGLFGPSGGRRAVHLYTPSERTLLLQAAGRLGPKAATFQTLLGLLAVTGMRIGEALRLRHHDIDWTAGTLTIHRSKSGRSRCLPLRPCTLDALRRYQRRNSKGGADSPFFQRTNGRPLRYGTAAATFRSLCRQLGWTSTPIPRLHDLRHTFAVECLTDWYRQGVDVNSKILALSTYLGHRSLVHTYWYLSATPQLLALVQARWPELTVRQGGSRAR